MIKNLKLMQVTTLIPATRVHELDKYLMEIGAVSVLMRPHYDNPLTPDEVKHVKAVIAKHKINPIGNGKGGGTVAMSRAQQQWLAKHITGDVPMSAIRPAWVKAGFRPDGVYGALAMAVRTKLLKKVKPGVYRKGA